ncbi:MAG TPA: MFS transporter [Thermoanaerobaculia bacterium]|jgi:EmrB/QacA subfamily drug resistance transporter
MKMRWALAGLCSSILLASLGTSVANVALPTFATAFAASFQQVQWVVLAYLLAITTLIVSAGRLGDLAGRRRLLLAGIALFTIASALCGLAPSLALLIAARAAQGLGAAIMTALALAFVSETVPRERTGRAMGLLGTMSAAGTALGPSLGGLAIAAAGWRAIFFLNLPLGLASFALAWRHLPRDRAARAPARFDTLGTLLLAVTLAAYALAMTLGRGHFGARNAALLLAALAGMMLFLFIETRAAAPLIQLSMLRDATLSAGFAANALVTTVVMTTLVVGPFHLAKALALGAAAIGLVMACGPVTTALSGVPAGRLVDRFGTARIAAAGLLAMAGGTSALATIPARFGIAGYLVPLVVTTAGYAFFQAANNTAVMSDLRADQRGVVSGMLNLSRNLGLITGASVMGALFAFGGMRMTFGVAAALVVIALVIATRGHLR